ncbi:uncharacterized protein FHX74_003952 [Friedmanniella endophytica]|uniref:Metal-binding protein n=1 Tax=Microlunatus kandeliicorticis TaxID=1759536 RepID=A0A7W3IW58_9ACTN|nr:DUF177 domain-containing protein [Microlunatus kandeliicorticis]MBA8796299.1 uncharacterized protein [Microlunatus kandeliicorticis]
MNSRRRPLDPRSGLVLDTHDLVRTAGAMQEVRTTAEAPDDLGTEMIGVPPKSPIELDLRLESVVEGVLVTGTADVVLVGQCARCLDEIRDATQIDVQELYVYPNSDATDDEAHRLEGELIDLEPVIRDAVVVDLPFQPLCTEDCAGLCPTCGANLNDDPEHDHEERPDPRWAALSSWDAPDEETVRRN